MLERTRINSTPATTNQEAMAASDTRGQHEYKGKGVASLPVTAPGLQSLQSLQKPKSAASKIRTKYLGDLSIPLEPRLTDIGLAAARPAESGSELLPYEVPLAAYLTAQSALNNPADTITAQRLSWANKAMAEARNLLPLGRSNVQDDHLASAGESNKRTQAQATLLDKIGSSLNPPSSATALWAGTGNAYQHMMLTAQSLMSRPAVVEQEHFNAIWSNEKTHAWLVSAPSQQPEDISHQTIYMDAFNDGPPMLVKHSAHNHGQVNLYSLQVTQHTVNHELAREKYNAQQLAVMLSPSQLSTGQEPHETTVRAQSGVLPMFAETAAIKMKRELSPQQASALAKISNPIKNQNETLEIILSFDKKIAQIRKKVKNKSLKNKDIHTAHTTIKLLEKQKKMEVESLKNRIDSFKSRIGDGLNTDYDDLKVVSAQLSNNLREIYRKFPEFTPTRLQLESEAHLENRQQLLPNPTSTSPAQIKDLFKDRPYQPAGMEISIDSRLDEINDALAVLTHHMQELLNNNDPRSAGIEKGEDGLVKFYEQVQAEKGKLLEQKISETQAKLQKTSLLSLQRPAFKRELKLLRRQHNDIAALALPQLAKPMSQRRSNEPTAAEIQAAEKLRGGMLPAQLRNEILATAATRPLVSKAQRALTVRQPNENGQSGIPVIREKVPASIQAAAKQAPKVVRHAENLRQPTPRVNLDAVAQAKASALPATRAASAGGASTSSSGSSDSE